MVDWKKIPKIDAHIHLMPKDVIAANRGNGDPFVEHASLMVDPSDLLSDLHAETSVYTYVPADLVALKELPHVNVNSTDKEVYVREAMVKPLEALSEAMSEASGS